MSCDGRSTTAKRKKEDEGATCRPAIPGNRDVGEDGLVPLPHTGCMLDPWETNYRMHREMKSRRRRRRAPNCHHCVLRCGGNRFGRELRVCVVLHADWPCGAGSEVRTEVADGIADRGGIEMFRVSRLCVCGSGENDEPDYLHTFPQPWQRAALLNALVGVGISKGTTPQQQQQPQRNTFAY